MKLFKPVFVLMIALCAVNAADEPPKEKLPEGVSVVAIEARPQRVELKHKFDYRQLLISGKLDSGETVDLTRMAKATVSGSAVSVSSDGLIRAKEDGSAKISYSF